MDDEKFKDALMEFLLKNTYEKLPNTSIDLIIIWDEFKRLIFDNFRKHINMPNFVDRSKTFDYNRFNSKLPFRAIASRDLE
ncbi:MAG: hypothetical protein ACFFAN_06000 [Promethearchaeota archaeon]